MRFLNKPPRVLSGKEIILGRLCFIKEEIFESCGGVPVYSVGSREQNTRKGRIQIGKTLNLF